MKSRWTILPLLARVSHTNRHYACPGYSATLDREGSQAARAVAWGSRGKRAITEREREAAARAKTRAGRMGTGAGASGTGARTTAPRKRETEEAAGGSATSRQKTSRPLFPRYAQG